MSNAATQPRNAQGKFVKKDSVPSPTEVLWPSTKVVKVKVKSGNRKFWRQALFGLVLTVCVFLAALAGSLL